MFFFSYYLAFAEWSDFEFSVEQAAGYSSRSLCGRASISRCHPLLGELDL